MSNDLYAGLPKKLRVGFIMVDVTVLDIDSADIAGIYGAANACGQRIILRPSLKGGQLVDTFIHEVLHLIHHVYGVDDESSEEHTTTQTAHGLVSFWKDNPKAIAWVDSVLKGEK